MARTFPMPEAAFANRLLIRSVAWDLVRQEMVSGLGSGQPLAAEIGPPYWIADVQLANLTQYEAVEQRALILMHATARPFLLWNRAFPGPLKDPTGAGLAGLTPTIHTIGAEGRSLRITGLPAGDQLSVGDMLHVDYASAPVRRSLHQVGEAATASGAGLTPSFDVDPAVPVGVTTGLAVVLVRAGARMIRVPGSYRPGMSERGLVVGMGFQAMQVRGW